MRRFVRSVLVPVVAVVLATAGSCAECALDADCAAGICSDGVCDAALPIAVASSNRDDDGSYSVVVVARFAERRSQIRVTRLNADAGDPCVPFTPRVVAVENDGEPFAPVEIVIDGLPPLGERFTLLFTLLSGSINPSATTSFSGPPAADGVGGFAIVRPLSGDIDVVAAPTVELEISDIVDVDSASVVVRPVTGPPLPRGTFSRAGDAVRATTLLARGPQIVEVEALIDGVIRRCSVAIDGVWNGSGDLELLLLAEPQQRSDRVAGSTSWLELSTRRTTATDVDVCTTDTAERSSCRSDPRPRSPAVRTIHQLTLSASPAVIDVGVVPVISSVPVSAVVRVTQLGRHVGVFGPVTLSPSAGESWLAGQLVIADGVVVATPAPRAPQPGLPW